MPTETHYPIPEPVQRRIDVATTDLLRYMGLEFARIHERMGRIEAHLGMEDAEPEVTYTGSISSTGEVRDLIVRKHREYPRGSVWSRSTRMLYQWPALRDRMTVREWDNEARALGAKRLSVKFVRECRNRGDIELVYPATVMGTSEEGERDG